MIKLEEIRINRVQAIAISAIIIVFLSQIFSAKPEIRKYSENISPTAARIWIKGTVSQEKLTNCDCRGVG